MRERLELSKSQALTDQKIHFLTEQVKELQTHGRETVQKYEQQLAQQKEELSSDAKEKVQKANEETQKVVAKYDAKRAELKNLSLKHTELENGYQKLRSDYERETAVYQEKVKTLETRFRESEAKWRYELAQAHEELEIRSETAIKDIALLEEENERHKIQILDLEKDLSEVQSNYERDSALHKEKLEFLTN
jgi:hypothetical protein